METKYKVGLGVGGAALGILVINQRAKVAAAAKATVGVAQTALNIAPSSSSLNAVLLAGQQPGATQDQINATESALAALVTSAAAANNITVAQMEQLANNSPNADTARTLVLNAFNANPTAPPDITAANAVAALIAAQTGQPVAIPNPAATPQLAVVTTNDQPPSGDLVIFDSPNGSQIGGAEKNGTVTIDPSFSDPVFAQISWPGGSRLGPANGFSHKQFLRLV